MDLLEDVGTGVVEDLGAALEVLAAVVAGGQLDRLQRRPHRPVEHQHAIGDGVEERVGLERRKPAGWGVGRVRHESLADGGGHGQGENGVQGGCHDVVERGDQDSGPRCVDERTGVVATPTSPARGGTSERPARAGAHGPSRRSAPVVGWDGLGQGVDVVDGLEPTGEAPARPSPRARAVGIGVALLVALVAALVAPRSWPAGEGKITLSDRGRDVATAPVEVGSDEPVEVAGTAAGRVVTLRLPDGVPTDAAVEGTLTVEVDGARVRPALDEVAVHLTLPDGRSEVVPLLRWDRDDESLVATRRPPVHAPTALALLAAAVILWVSTSLPLFATAVAIPVVLVATGATGPAAALAPFFNPIIVLFFAGFLLAEAMRRVELDRWAAEQLVGRAPGGPVGLFATLMVTSAFLSMWMSNTAAVAVLVPIALAVTAPVGVPAFTRVVVLGTAYAATLGGVGSAIGTPANMLAIEFLDTFEVRDVTFAAWFAYGLPMVVVFLPVVGAYLWWRQGVELPASAMADARRTSGAPHERIRLDRDRVRVLAIFGLVAAGWLTQSWHGLHPGIVALAGVVVLAVTGDVVESDLGRISWTALLTFGGGLTLGLALTDTGVADWVASRLGGLGALPDLVAVAVVAVVTLLLTTVASNTASAATLIPLSIPLAGLLGVDVTLLVVVVAIASSIDFALIIGTPPTMMAYSTGLFTPSQILRAGAVLDVAGLAVLLTVVVGIWRATGVL